MQKLEFNAEEMELLRDLLQHALSELDLEVFRTDSHDFKLMLKGRRDVMEHILAKLPVMPVAR